MDPEDEFVYVYFEISIDEVPRGRIILKLFSRDCPYTTRNFVDLTDGRRQFGYRNTVFHRAIPGFMIQGGEITNHRGMGPSIYGATFLDENFKHGHSKAGMLSMANTGRNTNGSQFFITTAPAPHLDGKHVVFGEVYENYALVEEIEACGSPSGKMSKIVKVMFCGRMTFAPSFLH